MNKPAFQNVSAVVPSAPQLSPTGEEKQRNDLTTTATTLSPSLRSCSPRDKASDWKLDYRDLLDAAIECQRLIDWHTDQLTRLKREQAAREPRLREYRGRA